MRKYDDCGAEYGAWKNAIHRCHSPKNKQFKDYGGRGISVWPEWRGNPGFWKFLAHIGPKPSSDLTLDRIDNDKGYEPGNVRWATRKTQQGNRRCQTNVLVLTINGESRTISEWSAITGIHEATILTRHRRGLTEGMLIAPPGSFGKGSGSILPKR